ncbi:MAG: Na(+)/H(+) antiporter subunit C [Mycobacteriaceae bacterium]|nr:Na(+)/H(+) antiporter subunit C [Mycobacteriaceae bacterium]
MSANVGLLALLGALVACGVYLILERRVTKMLLGMILVGNAVNLLLLTVGGRSGAPPVYGPQSKAADMTDPLAQAMILTAIVITMGLTAFVMGLGYRSFMFTSRDEVEIDPEDAKVVAKRQAAEDGRDDSDDDDDEDEPDGDDSDTHDSDTHDSGDDSGGVDSGGVGPDHDVGSAEGAPR